MPCVFERAIGSVVAIALTVSCAGTEELPIEVEGAAITATPDSARAALGRGEILRVRAVENIGTIVAGERYFVVKDAAGRTSATGRHRSFNAARSFAFAVPATADASLWGIAVVFVTDPRGGACLSRAGSSSCMFELLPTSVEESALLSRSQTAMARAFALSWSFDAITTVYASYTWADAKHPAYQRTRALAEALRYLAEAHPFIVDAQLSERVLVDMRRLAEALRAQHDATASATCGARSDFALLYGFQECMTAHFVSKALTAYLEVFVGEPAVTAVRDRIDQLYSSYADRIAKTPNANYNYNNRAMALSIVSRMVARRLPLATTDRATLLALHRNTYVGLHEARMFDERAAHPIAASGQPCTASLGFGSWPHGEPTGIDCAQPYSFNQYVGYHLLIVDGLTDYQRVLRKHELCMDPAFAIAGANTCDQIDYLLLGAASWLRNITEDNGCILSGWPVPGDPTVDRERAGTALCFASSVGLRAWGTILQALGNAESRFPYFAEFPYANGTLRSSARRLSFAELSAAMSAAEIYTNQRLAHGPLVAYPPLLRARGL
jgi:hypothetical protein